MEEHFSKNNKCAKYTLYHTPKKLETAWQTKTRSLASKLEYNIKTLSKLQKEELIKHSNICNTILTDKLDCERYKNLNKDIIYKILVNLKTVRS